MRNKQWDRGCKGFGTIEDKESKEQPTRHQSGMRNKQWGRGCKGFDTIEDKESKEQPISHHSKIRDQQWDRGCKGFGRTDDQRDHGNSKRNSNNSSRKYQNRSCNDNSDRKYNDRGKGSQHGKFKSSFGEGTRKMERREVHEQKSELKMKGQNLYLTINNFKGSEDDLKMLLEKITSRRFPISDFRYEDQAVLCTAEMYSARQVKDVLNEFVFHNRKSDMKVIARQEQLGRQIPINTLISECNEKMTREASDFISIHTSKIERIQERIDQNEREENEFTEDSEQKDEIKALKSKLQEMNLQKTEFQGFLKCTIDKLDKVRESKKVELELKTIYLGFQVECTRLKNALPIYARRSDIVSMIKNNQVSVLLGETGSGKSTQIAQYMYQTGMANTRLIVCTQPRKIAAISLATHVAREMETSVGQLVGYKVGMQIKQTRNTKIIYMTDHMLLNECLKDKNFSAYSCIIVDEAHERSIYTDLLLGMIKKSIKNRPDLRVVVTSATIDPAVFVSYFGTCPMLSVSGRMFPVEVVWTEDESSFENHEQAALDKTIEVHHNEEQGDILTFLTSPLEVERCCVALEDALNSDTDFICLPLHGRLQANEQQKVFDPSPKGKRKIVFATNSAETSITIPGIKYVIDTGVAKEMQFDPKRNISMLLVKTITQSSADQRKGRAGRTDAGKCFRLYSSETYDNMERNSRPEILRVHLGHALLKLMELGVVPLEFDFVQSPSRELLDAAMETLESVGAVVDRKITELGKWIAKLPIDPKFGKFIHDAIKEGIIIEAIILSACCSAGGSIFYRSGTEEEKSRADKLKIRFCHEGGDLMTMMNVFREWHEQPEKTKGVWCTDNSINGKAIRGVRDTVNEVLNVLRKDQGPKHKFQLKSPSDVDNKLQKMLFETFSRNLCHFLGHEKAGYLVVNKDQHVQLFPGSSLKSLGLLPNWIVIEQVLKTSNDFAINVTIVPDKWIYEAMKEGRIQLDIDSLKEQRVEQVTVFDAGEQVFRDFVGVKYSKKRELENQIKERGKGRLVFLDTSKQLGEISLYSQEMKHVTEFEDIIKDRVENLRQKFKYEKSEQFLSSVQIGVRVVIGAGMNIVDVLMADEYTTIFITGIPKFIEKRTEEEMTNTFEKFGKIVKIEKFRKSKNKNNWGIITFENKECAKQAVVSMKEALDIGARPNTGFQSADIRGFRTKLQWCRRPSKGFGFVKFTDPTNATRARITPIHVAGSVVKVEYSTNGSDELHVSNLNRLVNEDVLRHGFMDALDLDVNDIKRVQVIRQKVDTARDILDTFRQRLRRKVEKYVHEGTYELDLRPPKDSDFNFLAFISFSKPEEGIAACAGIDHSFVMSDQVVTMKVDLKTSIMIQKLVYNKYNETVDTLVGSLPKTEPVNIQQKELRNGNIIINLHSDSVESIMKVKSDIVGVIKGRVLDIESHTNINRLFTWDGKEWIKTVMEKTDTTIVADERILSVSVHGEKENQQSAIDMMEVYLQKLKTSKSKTISLKGDDKPPGLMKELMLRYEYDFKKLVKESGMKCIELNHRLHLITLIGEDRTIEDACVIINSVIESMIKNRKEYKLQRTQTRDCVVCFCPIEEGEIYRLEVCGHPYCKDCVELQFILSVKNNTFPLSCSGEGCTELLAWKDISNLSLKTAVPVNDVVRKATSSFVSKHKKDYKYCPTPDCPLIYHVTDKECLFCCPECEIRICTACHNQFHDGLTCSMVESMKKDDGGLNLWMIQNIGRAKYCPSCSTPIEKIDGCNYLVCVGCNSHICWACSAFFDSDTECYGHMDREHGSFV
ncbi:DHX8 [Mytilus coruscus]|uniref:DHX8 n=1 Tax=Mytilus coruscus TaxID=42192 RepID=A0A6J8BRL2_MYTCO|nr:DHX8 [Mytilus coruscus]